MRPQKLQLVKSETYGSSRMTNDHSEQDIITIENMTQMTEYVYEMYMSKVEAMKDQIPPATNSEMYSDSPKEDAVLETEYEIIDEQPPAKREAKENSAKKAEPKVFKPTPIINEVINQEEDVAEEEPTQQEEQIEIETSSKKANNE